MISDFAAGQLGAIIFGLGTLPATLYVALCTDEPGTGWDGTVVPTVEPPSGTGYLRVAYTTAGGWALADGGFVFNLNDIDFPTPTDDWGQVTHFALLDDDVAGNLWFFEQFIEAQDMPAGADVTIPANTMTFELANLEASIAE